MKKALILCIIPLFVGFKSGQEIDQKKMNRDLEIAKNILATLIKTGSDSFFGGTSIEASYIKDYGVVFTIPEHLVYFNGGPGTVFTIPEIPAIEPFDMQFDIQSYDDQDRERIDQEKAQVEQEKEMMKQQADQARMEAREARREAERTLQETRVVIANGHRVDDLLLNTVESGEINWEEIMITFLVDYADLIGQLQPDEKIVINQKSPFTEMFVVWEDDEQREEVNSTAGAISAEVVRKDIQAYKSGKIDRDDFVKKITITKNTPAKKNPDLEMFTSIFDRYYSRDLSESFISEGKPRYEVLDGFGAIVHIRAMSPGSKGKVYFYNPGDTWTMDQKQNFADDEKLYPLFKDNIKAFVLDYGRTVRSLGDSDKLRLEIKIQSCRECKVPKMLEVSTDISLLKQYDLQKISREKALAAIEIKEQF